MTGIEGETSYIQRRARQMSTPRPTGRDLFGDEAQWAETTVLDARATRRHTAG